MRMSRIPMVSVTIAAWLLLSNHCALASSVPVVEPAAETSGCPMHSPPAKKKPAAKTPCCKDIRALVVKSISAPSAALHLFRPGIYAAEVFSEPRQASPTLEPLDTGPPACFSFAESVLQESLPAHAPPLC
jgi:hypothetical protein